MYTHGPTSLTYNASTPSPSIPAADGTAPSADRTPRPVTTGQPVTVHFQPDQPSPPQSPRPRHTDTKLSTASSTIDPAWEQQCVLSLDGGGIRGFSELVILHRLMQEIEEIEKSEDPAADSSFFPLPYAPCHNNHMDDRKHVPDDAKSGCQYLPCHYFDYIGGTSTGGLISVMLGRLRMGICECIQAYRELAKDVFGSPRWFSIRGPIPALRNKYDASKLHDAIMRVVNQRLSPKQLFLGGDNLNSPRELCKTVCVAYAQKPLYPANHSLNAGPYLFRSYDHWPSFPPNAIERNPGPAHHIPIGDVARATSAAPTYFDTITLQNRKFGDGGFGTNNPAQELMREVGQMHNDNNGVIALLLSIGTGQSEVSRFARGNFAQFYTYLKAANKLASEAERVHEAMMHEKRTHKFPSHRFNVPVKDGLGDIKLDEFEPATLAKIEDITKRYCDEIQDELREVARILVHHRRARALTPKWEMVSTGVQYKCTFRKCSKGQKRRPCADNLRSHLMAFHRLGDETEEDLEKLEKLVEAGKCFY